jgi:phosphoglycolate phosphatase
LSWTSSEDATLPCVVLFDIDGTLITGPGNGPSPGVRAMGESSRMITGMAELHNRVEFAGRTDVQIARDLLVQAGNASPTAEQVRTLLDRYVVLLERWVQNRKYRPIGNVREGVIALRVAGATVGLGTGNLRRGAEAKLRSAGLDDLFDLDLGGYGDDGESRADVLRVGAKRCDPTGDLPVIVVGDTPHDIRAARGIGAGCIAVTTGSYDARALADCGADVVLPCIEPSIVQVVRAMLMLR